MILCIFIYISQSQVSKAWDQGRTNHLVALNIIIEGCGTFSGSLFLPDSYALLGQRNLDASASLTSLMVSSCTDCDFSLSKISKARSQESLSHI